MTGTELLARFKKYAEIPGVAVKESTFAKQVVEQMGGVTEAQVLLTFLAEEVLIVSGTSDQTFLMGFFLGWFLRGVSEGIELVPPQEKKEATT